EDAHAHRVRQGMQDAFDCDVIRRWMKQRSHALLISASRRLVQLFRMFRFTSVLNFRTMARLDRKRGGKTPRQSSAELCETSRDISSPIDILYEEVYFFPIESL